MVGAYASTPEIPAKFQLVKAADVISPKALQVTAASFITVYAFG